VAEKNRLNFNYTWKVKKYSPKLNELQISLEFTSPSSISLKYIDYVSMTVCGVKDVAETCPSIKPKLPKMLSSGEAAVAGAVKAVGNAAMVQGIIAYVVTLFASTAVEPLLADLSNLNLSIHLMIISITLPALLSAVMNVVLDLTTFEVLPTDVIYDWVTSDIPKGPTPAFEFCKYESTAYVRNVGTVVIFYWGIFWLIFMTWFLTRVSGEDDRLKKMKEKFNTKSQLNLLHASLLPVCVSTFIFHNWFNPKENPLSLGVNILNAGSMFLCVVLIPAYVLYSHRKLKWTGYEDRVK